MVKPAEGQMIEITAYDGMVVFSGFGGGQVILPAGVAEQIGYQLSAAAFAASCGGVRTWSCSVRFAPVARPVEPSSKDAKPEKRSFLRALDGAVDRA